MKLKLIACKVMKGELEYLARKSKHNINISWIEQKYHDTPEKLHELLKSEIAAAENEDEYDAVLLSYGLCSNSTLGLKSEKCRLVIPRAHDCITMFLGSKEKYEKYFSELPGCYWYSASWIENSDMPCKEQQSRLFDSFCEQGYDEETAEYLLEELEGLKNYRTAAYIKMPFGEKPEYTDFTKRAAEYFGWDYRELEGSGSLMEKLLGGEWSEEEFLVLAPGEESTADYSGKIFKALKE